MNIVDLFVIKVTFLKRRWPRIPPKCLFFKDTCRPTKNFHGFHIGSITSLSINQTTVQTFSVRPNLKRGRLCCKGRIWKQRGFPLHYGKSIQICRISQSFQGKSAGGLWKNKLNNVAVVSQFKSDSSADRFVNCLWFLLGKNRYLWIMPSYI